MLIKRCLVCCRDFAEESTSCYQCVLPLYNRSDPACLQEHDLGVIVALLMRRYNRAVQKLKPQPVIKPDPPYQPLLRRIVRYVMM